MCVYMYIYTHTYIYIYIYARPPPVSYHLPCLRYFPLLSLSALPLVCSPLSVRIGVVPSRCTSFYDSFLLPFILFVILPILPPPSPLVPPPSSHPSPLQALVIVPPFASFLTAIVPSTLYCSSPGGEGAQALHCGRSPPPSSLLLPPRHCIAFHCNRISLQSHWHCIHERGAWRNEQG